MALDVAIYLLTKGGVRCRYLPVLSSVYVGLMNVAGDARQSYHGSPGYPGRSSYSLIQTLT